MEPPRLQNDSPLPNEGFSHTEHGALTATISCWHYPIFISLLPHVYAVPLRCFGLVFTPFLLHMCRVKCQVYPVFTPLLPQTPFSPCQTFYPDFTPFLELCALQFPHIYPRGKMSHFLFAEGSRCFTRKLEHCSKDIAPEEVFLDHDEFE